MPIIEMQFRLRTLQDIVKAQVLTTALPKKQIDDLLAKDQYVDQVAVTDVTTEFSVPLGVDLPADPPPDRVHLRIRGEIRITDKATLRATPHLQPPAITQRGPVELYLVLAASPAGLDYRLAGMTVAFAAVAAQDLPAIQGTVRLAPSGYTINKTALLLSTANDLVTIRYGTRDDDNLNAASQDWLGTANFGMFLPGQAFADQLAEQLLSAVQDAAKTATNPKIEIAETYPGTWHGNEAKASAQVDMNAIDALPANFDLPFTLTAQTSFVVKISPHGGAAPFYMDVDTIVSWSAGNVVLNFFTFGGFFGKLQSGLNDGMKGKVTAPAGQVQVAQTDTSVTFHLFQDLPAPQSDNFNARIDDARFDQSGLRVRGRITPLLDVSATWTFTESRWVTEGDCNTKSLRRVRRPAQLSIVGAHPHFQIRPLTDPTVLKGPGHITITPRPGWQVSGVRYSQPKAVPVTFDVFYELPASVHEGDPVDSPFVMVYTNVGVRRVELSVVSVGLSPDALDPQTRIAVLADLISGCMAKSDRWGMGVFNLDWLVDPPDLSLGRPPLREWTISASEVTEVAEVEVVAIRPDQEPRVVGVLPVTEGRLFGQVVTRADETLEVRTGVAMIGPVPKVSQRWIVPFSAIPAQDEREIAIPRTRAGGASTVSVVHDGELIHGVAGQYVPANRVIIR